MQVLNQFKLVKNPDGTYSVPDEASDPNMIYFRVDFTPIRAPGVKHVRISAFDEHGYQMTPIDESAYPGVGVLYIHPTENISFPIQFAFGQYEGTVTLYYSEDRSHFSVYNLKTGEKIRDTFPYHLTMFRKDGERHLRLEGGGGENAVYIEASPDYISWRVVHEIPYHSGFWEGQAVTYGPLLYYRAFRE